MSYAILYVMYLDTMSYTMSYTISSINFRILCRIWYRIWYRIRYYVDLQCLCLVAWLHPTVGVQMFVACNFNSCLHFVFVSVKIRCTSAVKILVWTFADRAFSCVAHSRGCHLLPVQYKDVIKSSAQPNTIVCTTKVDIPWTQIV